MSSRTTNYWKLGLFVLVCLLLGHLSVLPNDNFMLEAVPFMLGFGLVAALLAYRHPKVFNVVLWFFP